MTSLKRWLPVVLWAAVILSSANDSFSAARSGGSFRFLFGRDLPYPIHVALRKSVHIAAYGILGLLAWRAHRGIVVPVAIALAVASADETLQSFTSMRTGLFADVVLDG
jgi:VanZ family protein